MTDYFCVSLRFEIQVGSVRLGDRVHIEEVRYHEQCYGVSAPGNNHGNKKVRSTWNKACIFVEGEPSVICVVDCNSSEIIVYT